MITGTYIKVEEIPQETSIILLKKPKGAEFRVLDVGPLVEEIKPGDTIKCLRSFIKNGYILEEDVLAVIH